MLKKILKIIFTLFIILLVLIILPFVISPIIDNVALGNYKKEVLDTLYLPPDTEIVETISGCGNTSGTGNHTEMYVAILVKTSLSEEEWKSYGFLSHDVLAEGEKTFSMSLVGVYFSHIDNPEGYYILEYAKQAPCSDFDIRGH